MTTISVPTESFRRRLGAPPQGVDVVVWDGAGQAPDDARDVELFVGGSTPAERATLESLPALAVVQLLSAGVDRWLPVVPDGVALCNARGVHGPATAEIAVAGLLAVLRELPRFVRDQDAGRWDSRRTDTVTTKRVLVLGGPGDIGTRVIGSLEALGATTTSVGHTARDGVHALDELPTLLPGHDVVVVALPLTDETRGLVDAAMLALLPDGAVLVNIARGPVVDTDALVAELTAGRLRAFLDVTDPEPLPEGHPLWDAPGLLVTPHVGGDVHGWTTLAAALVRDQAERLRDGRDLVNRVGRTY